MMKAENTVSVLRFSEIGTETHILHRGESGIDEVSTGTCGNCWSEAGDLGEICSYSWNEEKNRWDFNASCMTCGSGWTGFIPYKE